MDVLSEEHSEHLQLSVLAARSFSFFISLAPLLSHFAPIVTF